MEFVNHDWLRKIFCCFFYSIIRWPFRLSRDIYVDNIYMKSSAGRLPIKWLALESMTDQKYTSQSDVYVVKFINCIYSSVCFQMLYVFDSWSFGILLNEIVTMGSTPYPTVPVDCLINYLKSGNRMSKPFNCSQDLYDKNQFFNSIELEIRNLQSIWLNFSYDLMYSCWHQEPEKRPTFTEILQHLDLFIRHPSINGIISVVDVKRNEW